MTDRSTRVLKDALALPPADRAELVDQVLASLDTPARREIDAAWATEAEDRLDAFDRGEMPAVPAEEVFRKYKKPPRG